MDVCAGTGRRTCEAEVESGRSAGGASEHRALTDRSCAGRGTHALGAAVRVDGSVQRGSIGERPADELQVAWSDDGQRGIPRICGERRVAEMGAGQGTGAEAGQGSRKRRRRMERGGLGAEGNGAKRVDEVLNMDNPIFDMTKESTKIKIIVEEISRLVQKREQEGVMEKVIVVSQWTSMLDVIKGHLSKLHIKFTEISGKIPVKARGEIVDNFNQKDRGAQVNILSCSYSPPTG